MFKPTGVSGPGEAVCGWRNRDRVKICLAAIVLTLWVANGALAGEAETVDVNEAAQEPSFRHGEDPVETTRQLWTQHVKEERRRIRELAIQRRLNPPEPSKAPSQEEEGLRASERIFSDSTLERGDIIVTTKGKFVFKGQKSDERRPEDFEELNSRSIQK